MLNERRIKRAREHLLSYFIELGYSPRTSISQRWLPAAEHIFHGKSSIIVKPILNTAFAGGLHASLKLKIVKNIKSPAFPSSPHSFTQHRHIHSITASHSYNLWDTFFSFAFSIRHAGRRFV